MGFTHIHMDYTDMRMATQVMAGLEETIPAELAAKAGIECEVRDARKWSST